MAEDQNQEKEKQSLGERFAEYRAANAKKRPSFGAQMGAMGREALQDIRDTMFQVFFGQKEGPGELGTPLNPTPQMVTKDLGYGDGPKQSFTDMVRESSQRGGPDHGRGPDIEM